MKRAPPPSNVWSAGELAFSTTSAAAPTTPHQPSQQCSTQQVRIATHEQSERSGVEWVRHRAHVARTGIHALIERHVDRERGAVVVRTQAVLLLRVVAHHLRKMYTITMQSLHYLLKYESFTYEVHARVRLVVVACTRTCAQHSIRFASRRLFRVKVFSSNTYLVYCTVLYLQYSC